MIFKFTMFFNKWFQVFKLQPNCLFITTDVISNFLISKGIPPSYMRFCGLDGTDSMSSERCGLHRLIKHSSPHAEYIIAVITVLHCALFIYLKNSLHTYHLIPRSFLYGSCLSTVPSRKKFSTICSVFMS